MPKSGIQKERRQYVRRFPGAVPTALGDRFPAQDTCPAKPSSSRRTKKQQRQMRVKTVSLAK